eukprot:2301946-Rhodomonas_salina.1
MHPFDGVRWIIDTHEHAVLTCRMNPSNTRYEYNPSQHAGLRYRMTPLNTRYWHRHATYGTKTAYTHYATVLR